MASWLKDKQVMLTHLQQGMHKNVNSTHTHTITVVKQNTQKQSNSTVFAKKLMAKALPLEVKIY